MAHSTTGTTAQHPTPEDPMTLAQLIRHHLDGRTYAQLDTEIHAARRAGEVPMVLGETRLGQLANNHPPLRRLSIDAAITLAWVLGVTPGEVWLAAGETAGFIAPTQLRRIPVARR